MWGRETAKECHRWPEVANTQRKTVLPCLLFLRPNFFVALRFCLFNTNFTVVKSENGLTDEQNKHYLMQVLICEQKQFKNKIYPALL